MPPPMTTSTRSRVLATVGGLIATAMFYVAVTRVMSISVDRNPQRATRGDVFERQAELRQTHRLEQN